MTPVLVHIWALGIISQNIDFIMVLIYSTKQIKYMIHMWFLGLKTLSYYNLVSSNSSSIYIKFSVSAWHYPLRSCQISYSRKTLYSDLLINWNLIIFTEICNQPEQSGSCMAYKSRFRYKSDTNECIQFIYSGCGGNSNNFLTKESCEEACKVWSFFITHWL